MKIIKRLKEKLMVKKVVALVTVFSFLCSQTGFAQTVTNITTTGKTATTVTTAGNTHTINTATVHNKTGFNSFSNFDLGTGDIANLNLAANTDNLVNMVSGGNKSTIDGTLNAYRNGKIGGNVFFLNPDGIMIGANGIVNVGALTLAAPSAAYIDSILEGGLDKFNANTFSRAIIDGDIPLNRSGTISVRGKINAYYGAAIHADSVEIGDGIAGGQINTLKAANIMNLDDMPAAEVKNVGGKILITGKKLI